MASDWFTIGHTIDLDSVTLATPSQGKRSDRTNHSTTLILSRNADPVGGATYDAKEMVVRNLLDTFCGEIFHTMRPAGHFTTRFTGFHLQ